MLATVGGWTGGEATAEPPGAVPPLGAAPRNQERSPFVHRSGLAPVSGALHSTRDRSGSARTHRIRRSRSRSQDRGGTAGCQGPQAGAQRLDRSRSSARGRRRLRSTSLLRPSAPAHRRSMVFSARRRRRLSSTSLVRPSAPAHMRSMVSSAPGRRRLPSTALLRPSAAAHRRSTVCSVPARRRLPSASLARPSASAHRRSMMPSPPPQPKPLLRHAPT